MRLDESRLHSAAALTYPKLNLLTYPKLVHNLSFAARNSEAVGKLLSEHFLDFTDPVLLSEAPVPNGPAAIGAAAAEQVTNSLNRTPIF